MTKSPNIKERFNANLANCLYLKLFGKAAIYWQSERLDLPRTKSFAMLVYLSLQKTACTRRDISELLWGTTNSASLRVALSELRSLGGSETWLETTGQELKLRVGSDVVEFENALAAKEYGRALEVYGKDNLGESFLENFEVKKADEFSIWLEHERARLKELYLDAIQKHITELEKAEKYAEALNYSQLLLRQDKLNENVWRTVIGLEHKRGNTEKALEMFEQLREILKTELDVEPLPETLELLAQIEKGSVSAAKTAIIIKTSEQIPARPEQLIGRDDLLFAIDESLKTNKRLLLHGFGGSGKTAVVASYTNSFLENGSGNILWLQAGDDSPDSLFDAIAKAFEAGQKLSQAKDKAVFINKLLKNKIKLFILDDVWNAYALSKISETIPADIALVATSRQRYPRLPRIDVGRLKRQDSLELIKLYAKTVDPKKAKDLSKDKDLDELCELLADHAFALRIAGITLALNSLCAKELLTQIKDKPHRMKIPAEFAEQGRDCVSSLLAVSMQKLSDQAYEALMAFGAMYSSSCTAELLALCIRREEEATEQALIELQKAGLADRQTEAGSDIISYRLHDLVFSFAKANSNLRELSTMNACKNFLSKHKQDFDVLDAEITNLLAAGQSAQKYDDAAFIEFMRLLVDGNAYYQARGHSPRSIELLKDAIDRAKKIGDLEATHYLTSRLGDMYREQFADLDNAISCYQEALSLVQKIDSPSREAVLLCVIGGVYIHQQKDDAEAYLNRAYVIAKKYKNKVILSQILTYKGYLANHKKDYKLALKYLSEAVRVAKQLLIDNLVDEAEGKKKLFYALLNVGDVEQKVVGFDKALISREKALHIAKERGNQLWMAYALQEIAEMYHLIDETELAQKNYNQALDYYHINNAQADYEQLSNFMKENNYLIV